MSQLLFSDMARGQQKIQSQQKNAKKQAGQKKKQGHDQKAAAKAALIYTCTVCRVRGTERRSFLQPYHPECAQFYLKGIVLSWTVLSLGIGLYRLKFCKHSKKNALLEIDLRGDCVRSPSSFFYSKIYIYVCMCFVCALRHIRILVP